MSDFGRLEKILVLMSFKKSKVFGEMINLAEDFSICGVLYDTSQILQLSQSGNSQSFLREIIDLNSSSVLAKLNLQSVMVAAIAQYKKLVSWAATPLA